HYGIIVYGAMMFLVPSLTCASIPPISLSTLKKEWEIGSWRLFILAGANILGYGMMLKALSLGDASRVIPVATSATPLVVILSAIFLGERSKLPVKLFGGFLIV